MDTTVTHAASPWPRRDRADVRDPGAIPNYDLVGFIRAGGFGDVWLAREHVTGVRRVVKVLYKADPERTTRDIQGVRRYQRCAHNRPHLMQILTVGETDRCFYYVMEAADNAIDGGGRDAHATHEVEAADDASAIRARSASDGAPNRARSVSDESGPRAGAWGSDGSHPTPYKPTTLRTLMQTTGRFEARAALELVRKLVAGIVRLHEQGLAHYDLKPDNILLVEGEPKIADVGLVAPLDAPPPHSGTPLYMTPQGEADDLYALGRILYELISGRPSADFPRLPAELLTAPTPELAAAVGIINHACHPDAPKRLGRVEELDEALGGALRRPGGLRAAWRRWSRRRKAGVLAGAFGVAVLLGLLGVTTYARFVPLKTSSALVDLKGISAAVEVLKSEPWQRSFYPYLSVGGSLLPSAGRYAQRLVSPGENFVLDARVRFLRPWGDLRVGVAPDAEGRDGVQVVFTGQPGGLGLHTDLVTTGRDNVAVDWAEPIRGHPQPGIEYVARLARCRDGFVLALWPLASPTTEPIVRRLNLPASGIVARHLTIASMSPDKHAAAELVDLRVAIYSCPLRDIVTDAGRPESVTGQVVPAIVPPLPGSAGFPAGNLLAWPFHPYDSDAWMSIGSWSWWASATPQDEPKTIRCTPFSRKLRQALPDVYDGRQMLRFDRAAFGDFEVVARIKLADWSLPENREDHNPFVEVSGDGSVGLALLLGNARPPNDAWSGGLFAQVLISPDHGTRPWANIQHLNGFRLRWGAVSPHAQVVSLQRPRGLAQAQDVCPRAELFAPDGFTFTLRRRGPQLEVLLNGRSILAADDAELTGAARLALCSGRLIATFDSLEVTALPPGKKP